MNLQPEPIDEKGLFRTKRSITLILASASPRRSRLLKSLGLRFFKYSPQIVEPTPAQANGDPRLLARMAAWAKGEAAKRYFRSSGFAHTVILAADTVVCLNGEILGKPRNVDNALEMLRKLNGATHQVFTAFYIGLCPRYGSVIELCRDECTDVSFGEWPDSVLESYVCGGEYADKAGAYAIQGYGAVLVKEIKGSWSNVVGLPIENVARHLLENGVIEPANV